MITVLFEPQIKGAAGSALPAVSSSPHLRSCCAHTETAQACREQGHVTEERRRLDNLGAGSGLTGGGGSVYIYSIWN